MSEVAPERPPIGGRPAIVHDWFQGFHGAERTVEAMRTGVFAAGSEPDVYTFHAARELLPAGLARSIVQESRLAALPGIRQRGHDPGRWRWLLPTMPYWFRGLDLSSHDLVISSSHAFAIQARPAPGAIHVCYCYTPLRYVWLPETDARAAGGPKDRALRAVRGWLRRLDLEASARPHGYVAISGAVRERIRRFYGRDAEVIHPPVDVQLFDHRAEKEAGRFLWVHRLVEYKRPELVAEAFRGLPHRLTMVGVGPLEARLRARLPENVELLGWVSQEELALLLARASGFVHVGEEDFGITMVEALASGTPVIALARGGARDVVRDGEDGVLLEQTELGLLREAIEAAARSDWDPSALAARAGAFSREVFVARLRDYLASLGAAT
ncbi:MAG: glycosyltransferase [Actinobacteria bacterium]|nr:glycosyltransferase [Actinomycetota bacterium]